jgi:TonB family protein
VPLCPATFNDSIETDRIAGKGDKSVTLPKLTYQPAAEFSDEARSQEKGKKRISDFHAYVRFVVDATGKPQNVCLMQSTGWGLDAKAAEAVLKYQFKPATKDGKPVAVRLTVRVDFHLY